MKLSQPINFLKTYQATTRVIPVFDGMQLPTLDETAYPVA
jgi:hypothetical protein